MHSLDTCCSPFNCIKLKIIVFWWKKTKFSELNTNIVLHSTTRYDDVYQILESCRSILPSPFRVD